MSRVVTAGMGAELRRSRWGDGDVNGVGFENALRVVEYTRGWLVEGHWIFWGGRLWLPRAETPSRTAQASGHDGLQDPRT